MGDREHHLQLQGRWTSDVNELVAECDAIREGMARYGLTVIGYDPGVLVGDAANPNAPAADIPTWLLKKLLAALSKHGEKKA